MTLYLERMVDHYQRQGIPELASMYARLAAEERERGGPFVPDPVHLSSEAKSLVTHLEGEGYKVYRLAINTIAGLRREHMRFRSVATGLNHIATDLDLVAFMPDPSNFFLKGSKDVPYSRMVELLEAEMVQVDRRYPGAGLIVREGTVSEWAQLAWRYRQESGRYLFGREDEYCSTWTSTAFGNALRASVGPWDEQFGMKVEIKYPDTVDPKLGLAPLIEIPRLAVDQTQ